MNELLMNSKNSKVLAAAFFAGTLAIGVAAGVFLDRAWLQPSPREFHNLKGRESGFMRQFGRELDLTAGQQAELDHVLANYRERFSEIRRSMHPRYNALRDSLDAEIRALLTPAQQEKFDRMKSEARSRGSKRRGGKRE